VYGFGAQDETMTTSRLAFFLATIDLLWLPCLCADVQKVGVSSRSSNQQLLSLNFTNNGQQVAAEVGQRIEITLGTVGPRQYGDPQISSSVIRLDSVALATPVNPGGPTFIYMFEAAAEGEAQVKIPIINSQDQYLTKRLTFTVRIRVGSAKTSPAPNAFTTPDQTNTAPWKNASINVHNSLSQTFTPSLPMLTALEVELVVANPGPASSEVTMALANAEGQSLAYVSKTVAVADCRHVLFVFPKGGLRVTPGQIYSITLSSVDTIFAWKYVVGGYANGAAMSNGFPGKPLSRVTRTTFLFRTFGAN
jgi:archaellum component FlaF (FlaF/FlaG flagellin family)